MEPTTYYAIWWTDNNGEYPVCVWQMAAGAPMLYATERLATDALEEMPYDPNAEVRPIAFPALPEIPRPLPAP